MDITKITKRIAVNEDMHPEKEWFEQAAKVKTTDELVKFMEHVMNDYSHDYGTVVHAVAACAIAASWVANEMDGACGGITGFQAGFVMWDYIRQWEYSNNKCGMKLLNFDNLLYPQCEHRFDKTIESWTWEQLQKQAAEKLKDTSHCHPRVVEHWKSIVDGKVPFGFEVRDE